MSEPPLAELIELCERALAGELREEELQKAWPPEEPMQLPELREALFDGLEHMPGHVTNGEWRLDPVHWRTTPEYDDIRSLLEQLREVRDRVEASDPGDVLPP